MIAIETVEEICRKAPPVCLWPENPYNLVSLLQMVEFDASKFSKVTLFLGHGSSLMIGQDHLENAEMPDAFDPDSPGVYYREQLDKAIAFCEEHSFDMAKIPIARAKALWEEEGITYKGLLELLSDGQQRLRDEAGTRLFFKVQQDKAKYYRAAKVDPFGGSVSAAFPSTTFDASEACRCFALGRSTASVFHLMRVMEIGLSVMASRFGVPSDHTNWHNIIEGIEKSVRNLGSDPNTRPVDWKDQQEFFSQAASHFMITKDAWRNYTAHARGKYTDEEAETLMINVRSFIQKLATRLHE